MATAVLDKAEQDLQDAERAEEAAEAKRRERGDYVEGNDDDDAAAETVDADAGADKAEDKADDKRKDNTPRVPSWRLKEESSRADREREDRLRVEGERDALKKQLEGRAEPEKKKDVVDVDALRDQANEAMIEGDTAKANTLRRQADKAEREQIKTEAKAEALAELRAEEGQREIVRAARAVVKDYPFLDSNNAAERDEEAIEQVVALRDTYVRTKGMTPGEALTAAAERVGKLVLRERALAAKANGEDEDEDEAADDKGGKKKDPAAERTAQAITRGANAARKQPAPPIGGKGERAAQMKDPDPSKMTDAEFEKLTPAEKSRLRGDVVE